MRKTMMGLAAAFAVMAAGAAPAMACGGDLYGSSCSRGLFTSGFYDTQTFSFEHLPEPAAAPQYYPPAPQYYYVNQGPTYSGPGEYAPLPTYQQRAVSGWYGYQRGYYYGYNGGPYGDATSHYYDGMPNVQGPVVYRYAPRAYRGYRQSLRYGYSAHRAARYGYGSRYAAPRRGYAPHFYGQRMGMHGPHVTHAPRYAGSNMHDYRHGPRPHGVYRY
jgi:hypothetical protein